MVKRKGDNHTTTTTTTSATTITSTTIDGYYHHHHHDRHHLDLFSSALPPSPAPLLLLPSPSLSSPSMFLPFPTTLPDGKCVIVNRVTDHQVSEIYDMIQDSAMNGEGYGVDEFPTEKDFVKEVHNANGKIFNVADRESGATVAAFVILDSKYFRGQNTVADSYMVVRREERRKGLGEFCMRMILEFSRRLGYSGIYGDTFNDNIAMRKIIEQSGFQKVGLLPMSARMPDGSVKPSVIYYRELAGSVSSTHQGQIGDRSNANLQEGDSTCVESDTLPT